MTRSGFSLLDLLLAFMWNGHYLIEVDEEREHPAEDNAGRHLAE